MDDNVLDEKGEEMVRMLIDRYFTGADFDERSKFLCVNDDPRDGALRALSYSRFNFKGASQYIESNLNWRRKNDLDDILSRPLPRPKVMAIRNAFGDGFHGEDKEGYPIYWCPASSLDFSQLGRTVSLQNMIDYHLQTMEFNQQVYLKRFSKRKKQTFHSFTCVVDMDGFGSRQFNKSFRECLSAVSTIDRDYYHDNFHRVVILNAPMIIRLFWRTITPFLRKETTDKFLFLDKFELLFQYVDKEMTPKRFGGFVEDENVLFNAKTKSTFYTREMDAYMDSLSHNVEQKDQED